MAKDLSCGVNFLRLLLYVLNILFVMVGIALLGIGIYIKVDNNFASILNDIAKGSDFNSQSLGFLAYMMIAVGVVTLLIALFGFIGALWKNRCVLYVYVIILVILMIIELVGFIMAFVYKGKLQSVYEDTLSKALQDGLKKNDTTLLGAFQQLEKALQCCGVHNITDYKDIPREILSPECQRNPPVVGCAAKIIDFLSSNLPIIGGTLGGVLGLELFCLIASIVLARALKDDPDTIYSSNPGKSLSSFIPRRR